MSQIWDVDMFKIQASGIYGKECSISIPKALLHIPRHIRRSHIQWPGLSFGIRIGILSGVLSEKYETGAAPAFYLI